MVNDTLVDELSRATTDDRVREILEKIESDRLRFDTLDAAMHRALTTKGEGTTEHTLMVKYRKTYLQYAND